MLCVGAMSVGAECGCYECGCYECGRGVNSTNRCDRSDA